MQGVIFDLQRCSLHDGPGIRTTVFLKGCPLRCRWCHNPEAIHPRPEIALRVERCQVCGACAQACPNGVHSYDDRSHYLDRRRCAACAQCVPGCPAEALRRVGERVTVESVLAEVALDRDYYLASGGGITLSGGEPLLQFEFTCQLLQAAKADGLHTCLETCGYAPQDHFRRLLPLVDLFLFDYKATDPARHKALTGVSNRRILTNLAFLLANGAQIILRCPLAPGVNDDPGHLAGIAALAQKYPQLRGIELMPYHDLGRDKAAQVGRPAGLEGLPSAGEADQQRWLKALRERGCEAVRIG